MIRFRFCPPKLGIFIAAAMVCGMQPAQAQGNGGTIVAERLSGKCIGITGSQLNAGANLIQWPCNGNGDQRYIITERARGLRIMAAHSNKCLGVAGGAVNRGASIVQLDCANNDNQLWEIRGNGANREIMLMRSNLCMAVDGASRANGANIVQRACNGSENSTWRVNALLPGQNGSNAPASHNRARWDGPYTMPIVPVAASNLPDGRILTWAATAKMDFRNSMERTSTSIFNPATNASTDERISNTQHDMFCPATAQLPDGRLLVSGGSTNRQTSLYDPVSDTWSRGADMNIGRGYHSAAVLANGSVLTMGASWSGGRFMKEGEVWSAGRGWELKPNLRVNSMITDDSEGIYRADNHMWLFTGPTGEVFHAGPSRAMHWLTTSGNGRVRNAGNRGNDRDAMNGTAVMYDIGKILTVGGAEDYNRSNGSRRAYTIDINGGPGNVEVERVGNLAEPRTLHNAVVLPNGEVVIVGGQQYARIFSDVDANMTTEIWNPRTQQFRSLESEMQVPRTYHSVALLMKDGRVFVGGGGLCGACPTNHPDAEILTPPYLLNANGRPATRPVLSGAPNRARAGQQIDVRVDTNGEHTFALVRTSSVTHSVNNDERRVPVTAAALGGGRHRITIPRNRNVVIPGNYFLFAMNADGVPSIASTVRISGNTATTSTNPSFQANLALPDFSGKCAGIRGSSVDAGTPLIQWPCNGARDQDFQFTRVGNRFQIRAQHSNLCLAVEGNSTSGRARIVQLPCTNGDNRLWQRRGSGRNVSLRSERSGMCMGVASGSQDNGAEIVQMPCRDSRRQSWRLRR